MIDCLVSDTPTPATLGIIEWLTLDQLTLNRVQPAERTTNDALKALMAEVRHSQTITPLIVVKSGDAYTVCDGHRRLAVAQRLGYASVPCFVLPEGSDPTRAFVGLNIAQRPITGRNWLTIFAQDPDVIASFTPKTRANIETLRSWIGLREVVRIGREGKQAPSIVGHVLRILATLNSFPSTAGVITGGDAFYWLTTHAQQRVVVEYLKRDLTQAKAVRLLRAIQSNQPLA